MSRIVITGSGDGLGHLLGRELSKQYHEVIGITLEPGDRILSGTEFYADVRNFGQVWELAEDIGEIDILINCAGVNKIGYLETFDEHDWDQVMDTNAKGIFNVTKAFLPGLIQSKGTVLNIVSNASHMPMTGSLAYNASKGAAHIMTLQLARELTKRHGITVFGCSPNKLAGTGMSLDIEKQVCESRGWSPAYAKQYQMDALLVGEETDPQALAEFLAWLLHDKKRHKFLSGCIIPYGA